jgi:uncharacterized membrane protein
MQTIHELLDGSTRQRQEWRDPTLEGEERNGAGARALALGLACVGLGLGAAQIVAPRAVSRLVGVRPKGRVRNTLLGIGLREVACGLGIVGTSYSSTWLWARALGRAMDVGLLTRLLATRRSDKKRVLASLGAVAGVTLLDVKTAIDMRRFETTVHRGVHVSRAITVNRPREEVYRLWHDFENLPRFMAHLESVRVLDGHSIWKARGPLGTTIEWEAEIAIDRPNELIAWRSRPGSDVRNRGSVKFLPAPGGRGTELRVELRYDQPGGLLGAAFAKVFGAEPGLEIEGDLRRFKQVVETGEVLHSDASIHRGTHPARPPELVEPDGGKW